MKQQITEVTNYFKDRILSGDYEIIEITNHIMQIKVDDYVFVIWTANLDIPYTIKTRENSFMQLTFKESEQLQLQKQLMPIIDKYRKEVLIEKKEKELEELKSKV